MKHIKTFESFSSVNEEEGFLTKLTRGGTTIKMDDATSQELKAKYCIVKSDGQATKPTKTALFTLEGDKVLGLPNAMAIYSSLMKTFQMDSNQALTAAMGIYDWNGFVQVDPKESKFDKEKMTFSVVKAESTRGSGFNN